MKTGTSGSPIDILLVEDSDTDALFAAEALPNPSSPTACTSSKTA